MCLPIHFQHITTYNYIQNNLVLNDNQPLDYHQVDFPKPILHYPINLS